MLYGYLSRVYTDLVSLPLSVEMTGERSLYFPATISRHHITVLTVQVRQQHLGCYRLHNGVAYCDLWGNNINLQSTKAHLGIPYSSSVRATSASSTVEITAENRKQISGRSLGQKRKLETKISYWSFAALTDFLNACHKQHCLHSQEIKGFTATNTPPPWSISPAT